MHQEGKGQSCCVSDIQLRGASAPSDKFHAEEKAPKAFFPEIVICASNAFKPNCGREYSLPHEPMYGH